MVIKPIAYLPHLRTFKIRSCLNERQWYVPTHGIIQFASNDDKTFFQNITFKASASANFRVRPQLFLPTAGYVFLKTWL
jgi:hypothetical protein